MNEMSLPGLHNCTNVDYIVFVLKYRVLQFVFAISKHTTHNGLGNGFVSYLVTQFMHLL